MADRHPQYSMMPNFNPSLQQQQQMQQHGQSQQPPGEHQAFSEQNQLWSLSQFRPNSGGDVSQIGQQMANLIQSQSIARQQPHLIGGQPGAGQQQAAFHDPQNQRNPLLAGGFHTQPSLSQTSMQTRNAMMQAFSQNNRQLNLIDMAGNQQNQHNFPSRNPNDMFAPAMNPNPAMRQPSPAHPMSNQAHIQPLLPNTQQRPTTMPPELQARIVQVQAMLQANEKKLHVLHSNRANFPEPLFMQQAQGLQKEITNGKSMLTRLVQYATSRGQQQQQQPQSSPPGGQHQGGPQTPWPPSQGGPSFGQQPNPQANTQPSPSQRHLQNPHNVAIPPNRSITTPHQPNAQQNNTQFMSGPSNSQSMNLPQPLERERFEKAFENYLKNRNLTQSVRSITVEGRPLDFHAFHSAVFKAGGYNAVCQKDNWAVIGGSIGFVQFPGQHGEDAKSGPVTAHQLDQIYKEFIAPFDTAFLHSIVESRRKYQLSIAQMQGAAGQTGIQARGPMPNPQQMQMIMTYADQSVEQLRQGGVAEGIINFIEQNRAHLQRTAIDQKNFRNNFQNGGNVSQPPNGMTPGRAYSSATPPNTNPMQHQPGPSHPSFQNGMPVGGDGANQEHRPQVPLPMTKASMMQQVVRTTNQEQLTQVTRMLTSMKSEFVQNRLNNLPPIQVPTEQRMEYNSVVDQLYRSANDLDSKLPMLYLFLKNDAWIRKVAIIVVTVQQQRTYLSSGNPRFIVSLENLRHMLQEVQKAHEGFNNTMQNIANNQSGMPRPLMNSVPIPPAIIPPQQIPTPQPHPSLPHNRAPPATIAPPQSGPAPSIRKKPSMQSGAAASPTPPPASASTPVAQTTTPSAVAQSPKSPKTKVKAKPAPKARRASKVTSTPNAEPAAPSPSNGVKRPREDDAPTANLFGSTPPYMAGVASEASPPKKLKTDWEGSPNDMLKQREEQAAKIETPEDANSFLEQMTELIKMAAGNEGQESLSSDISDTLDMILKGYGPDPDGMSNGLSSLSNLSEGRPPSPSVDEFEFFDFSSFETEAPAEEDDTGSKAATPDLVPSSTNPSPESGSEADAAHHALTFSDFKTEEPADLLRLSTMKEVDGGESAYFQSTEWKWDGPMATLDQPWAISMS